ncbi:MAG: cytochrome c [Ignavibacteria bacterium]|nr:cytochrome c [Ignavibacteria bacterium]MCC7158933.1 cytochrome c [Ignavibacteria bacterium]
MKQYLKYYASIYVIFLIAIVVMGTMYINDLPNVMQEKIGGFPVVTKDTAKDITNAAADLPMIKGTLSPPVDVMKYLNPTPDLVDKGKSIFTMNCVSCHGDQGKGDGVAGASLNPKPRNFQDLAGWTNGPSITMLYKTLHEGITNRGMASYANLPPEDRLDMIAYIRTLNPGYPPITKVQLDSIDVLYSLTKGVKLPNQIPVKLATEKIIQQSAGLDAKVQAMVNVVNANKSDTGAVVLKSITNNLTKAFTVLAKDTTWSNNESALVKIFANDPVQNGFRASASYMLTAQQLNVVHAYLRKLFLM